MEHSVRDHIIDVHIANINELLDQSGKIQFGRDMSIFRVPHSGSDVQKNAFLPKTISIGPFHYVSPPKDTMYPLKLSLLQHLLGGKVGEINVSNIDIKIESHSRNAVLLKDLLEAIMDLEQRTRECYAEIFDINSDEFVNMMVIDSCFVIELLRLHYKYVPGEFEFPYWDCDWKPRDSPGFTIRWLIPNLQRDLIKLENQLPYFVLEKLFLLTTRGNEPSLPDLSAAFFWPMLLQNKCILMFDRDILKHTMLPHEHSVDFIRGLVISGVNKWPRYDMGNPKLIYSAQELQKAGVAFIKKENSNPLDISFHFRKGVLLIPPLSIDENTKTALLNIVVYEQWTQCKKPFFTIYFLFLHSLIHSTKDVEILGKNEIIKYPLGSEKEVVDLFKSFCKEIRYSFDQYFLSVNMNDVNNYCKAYYGSKWRIWWSNLNKERFSVAAIFLTILTLLQTIYTMFSYYHPN